MRRQKGNLANWHGFGGGQLSIALVVPPEMQICTSEIAAVNPPMGGICRAGHRSANLRNGVQAHCRQGGCAKLRILVQMGSGKIRQLADLWPGTAQHCRPAEKAQICAITRSVRCSSLAVARVDLFFELLNGFDNALPLRHFAEDHPSHGRVVPAQLGIHCR